MFQLNLFNAKLAACKVSKGEIAATIGCNESTLYRKLNGKSDFTRNEIQMIRQKLKLSAEEIENIFFAWYLRKCKLNSTNGHIGGADING